MLRLVPSVFLTTALFLAVSVVAQASPHATPSPPQSRPRQLSLPEQTLSMGSTQPTCGGRFPLSRITTWSRGAVSGAELNRATLDGVLRRLGRGAMLLPAHPAATPTPAPFYREIIDGHIGYLRPGDFDHPQLGEFDTTLRGFAGKKVDAIVLDLRGCVATNDYAAAAEFANRFVPKDKQLFSLRGPEVAAARDFSSKQDPLYSGFSIVLIDGQTVGATEVLTGILRHYDKTILIGQTTAGRAVEYT